jgi:hypothetical protein
MTEPRLYIIMREDLWDMNPGKGMAQAAHAQADFDTYAENHYTDDDFRSAHIRWCEDRNFGTTLVLSAPSDTISLILESMPYAGIVVDPTYPYRNYYGKVFTSSEITCAWVFATTEEEIEFMKEWKLHP